MKQKLLSMILLSALALTIAFVIRKGYSFYLDLQVESTPQYQKILQSKGLNWLGPEIGEKINLNELTDKNGKSFLQNRKYNKVFLVYVHPKCGMCKLANQQIKEVIQEANKNLYDVAIVSFNALIPIEQIEEYKQEFIGDNNTSYSWKNYDSQVSKLVEMGTPSFVITDSEGVILRKYPGSSVDARIRRAMTKEIITGLVSENNTK